MSVNMTLAMNPEKTKHLGKYFHTIDYNTISEGKSIGQLTIGSNKFNLSLMQLKDLFYEYKVLSNYAKAPSVVTILGYEFKLTQTEIIRIYETVNVALNNINKKLKLGI